MELEEVHRIFQGGWGVSLSSDAFVLSAPSQPEAFNLAYFKPEALAEWALRFGRGVTLIKYPQCGNSPYRIPATMAYSANSPQVIMNNETPLVLDPGNPLIEVYCLALSPALYREMGWFLENPSQAGGIVRADDNQQVAMSYANAKKDSDFTAGAGVKKAVKWKRSDYWHPQDLADFEREWRQKLEPNNPDSWMEFKWRSFDPDLGISSPNGWIEFANYYKLLVDDHGNTYHVSQNLGMRDIGQPVGVMG